MQERMEQPQAPKSVFSGLGNTAAKAQETVARTQNLTNKVRVVYGSNQKYFDLVGKDVGSVRKSLKDVFNIPGDAKALVGGKEVNDEFVLDAGQHLEFNKVSGQKGNML